MTPLDVRPESLAARPGDEVVLLADATAAEDGEVVVTHLGAEVRRTSVTLAGGRSRFEVGRFPEGSYAVRLTIGNAMATTAFDVLADPVSRPRYGFLADFFPGRADAEAVVDSLRAFHVNVVQLYDWMHRHASLLPPSDRFVDALGRELSLTTVRALTGAVQSAGGRALAYAAVYAAGEEYARAHPEQVLRHRDGSPWQLAHFLWIMDVSPGSAWTGHLVGETARAVREMGFDGLHLDQYGDPKVATTADDRVVDLVEGFRAVVRAVRDELPGATLIFNNVNDFSSAGTLAAPQDVTYVEVWPPHDTYADLVRLVDRARDLAPARPVVLAAYLAPFGTGGGTGAVVAATLALSTVWASGGQYLLFGERHAVLTDPYYPRYATLEDDAVPTLRAFADFAVANGDLLVDPASIRATRHLWQGINEDVTIVGAPCSAEPEAGSLWVRLSTAGRRLVVQLVDLRSQRSDRWNEEKAPTEPVRGLQVRVRVASPSPDVFFGHPLAGPELVGLKGRDGGDEIQIAVPDFETWALLVVDR